MQISCDKILAGMLLVCTFLFWPPYTQAGDEPATVKVAVGFSIEPWMLKDGKGIIGRVITESFLQSGSTVEFNYLSNEEALNAFNQDRADAVTVVKKGMVQGEYSEPLITFHNYVISLAQSGIEIKDLGDLKNYRVIAFSDAHKYLGADFSNAVANSEHYRELARQELQVKALFDGEAEIIIADKTIFEFYRTRLRNRSPLDLKWQKKIEFDFRFPESVYHVAFKTTELQQLFNKGFEYIKATGRYKEIVHTYMDLMDQY